MESWWIQVIIPVGSAMLGGAVMFGVFKQKIKDMEEAEIEQARKIKLLEQNKVDHDECQRCRKETCRRIEDVKYAVKDLSKETKVGRKEIQQELVKNKETVLEKFAAIASTLGAVQQYMKEHGT